MGGPLGEAFRDISPYEAAKVTEFQARMAATTPVELVSSTKRIIQASSRSDFSYGRAAARDQGLPEDMGLIDLILTEGKI